MIDDEVSVRESLELLLAAEGWLVETFASTADFMSRPRATVPCCLVLDVRLQGHSGFELQRQLAGRTDIPIIFITGYGDIPMIDGIYDTKVSRGGDGRRAVVSPRYEGVVHTIV